MAFAIEPSPEIWCRDDFPYLCMWRKLYRVAEIGVDRGEFARLFLERWIGDQFWGIDPYLPYPTMSYDRQADYLMAVARLEPHGGRAKLIRENSLEAADYFAPGSLDFIYIDGAHDFDSVRRDLKAWYPKLSDIGILAGHDWTDQEVHAGVKPAVTEFAREIDQTIYITSVEGFGQEVCPSWYVYRNGLPGADWRRC